MKPSQPTPQRNRYQNLMFNTILFALATFAPKLVPFVINAVVSRTLDTVQYSDYDQIINFCNLILPIIYITISEAVIRFGSDNTTKKTDVYTTAILVLTAGYSMFIILRPVLMGLSFDDSILRFPHVVYPYVLASALRTINSHFVRSLGKARLFAIDGVLTTIVTAVLSLIFLLPMNLGPISQVLATIVADGLSALFLFFMSGAWRYFKPKNLNLSVSKSMISYSLLVMPTTIFWWVVNTSNRSMIREFHGREAAGIYGNIARVPALITSVSAVFIQAWQMSAFSETEGQEREDFFARIFKAYYTFLSLAVSGLILIIRPFIRLYVGERFYEGWRYAPFLLIGIAISCLVTFIGTIYNTYKQNFMITLTTGVGAVANYALNRLLIPGMGPQGAAISTAAAYLLVFIIRLVHSQRFMDLKVQPVSLLITLLLLVGQALLSIVEVSYGWLWQLLIFVALVVINFRHIQFMVTQGVRMVKNWFAKRKKAPESQS